MSHSPLQILELCDVALLLDAGQMLLLDEPRRVVPEYQRLLYATHASAARLRQRLLSVASIVAGGTASARDSSADAGTSAAVESGDGDGDGDEAAAPAAQYDPDLRSSSTVEYAEQGARIRNPRITTMAGDAVNVLVGGNSYAYEYEVEFLRSARRVGFGMMIKTTSGLELGGGTFPERGEREAEMPAGARLRVRFEFRCQLFAGTYFVNAGAVGEVDGEDVWLHRLVDAVVFRVQPDGTRRQSGYVDFGIRVAALPVGKPADE